MLRRGSVVITELAGALAALATVVALTAAAGAYRRAYDGADARMADLELVQNLLAAAREGRDVQLPVGWTMDAEPIDPRCERVSVRSADGLVLSTVRGRRP